MASVWRTRVKIEQAKEERRAVRSAEKAERRKRGMATLMSLAKTGVSIAKGVKDIQATNAYAESKGLTYDKKLGGYTKTIDSGEGLKAKEVFPVGEFPEQSQDAINELLPQKNILLTRAELKAMKLSEQAGIITDTDKYLNKDRWAHSFDARQSVLDKRQEKIDYVTGIGEDVVDAATDAAEKVGEKVGEKVKLLQEKGKEWSNKEILPPGTIVNAAEKGIKGVVTTLGDTIDEKVVRPIKSKIDDAAFEKMEDEAIEYLEEGYRDDDLINRQEQKLMYQDPFYGEHREVEKRQKEISTDLKRARWGAKDVGRKYDFLTETDDTGKKTFSQNKLNTLASDLDVKPEDITGEMFQESLDAFGTDEPEFDGDGLEKIKDLRVDDLLGDPEKFKLDSPDPIYDPREELDLGEDDYYWHPSSGKLESYIATGEYDKDAIPLDVVVGEARQKIIEGKSMLDRADQLEQEYNTIQGREDLSDASKNELLLRLEQTIEQERLLGTRSKEMGSRELYDLNIDIEKDKRKKGYMDESVYDITGEDSPQMTRAIYGGRGGVGFRSQQIGNLFEGTATDQMKMDRLLTPSKYKRK